MFFLSPSENQDVIQIHNHYAFYNEVSEEIVHYGLEGGWTISHAKEHYQGFEEAVVGAEGCLPLIPRSDLNIVEPPLYIEFSKVPGTSELCDELRYQREGVFVLDCHSI